MNLAEKVIQKRIELGLSQDDLAKRMGYSSRSSINKIEKGRPISQKIIHKLAKALNVSEVYLMGYTDNEDGTPSNVFIPDFHKVPMLGSVPCGEPKLAIEENGEYGLIADEKADFCLRANGDSMAGVGIRDGDLVFCKEADVVDNGSIAVVIIDSDATLKRFYYYPAKNMVILRAENPAYSDLIYQGPEIDQIRVIGKAIAFQGKL